MCAPARSTSCRIRDGTLVDAREMVSGSCPGEVAVSENETGGFFNIMLEIDAQASENKKRLAERFDAACLRGEVAAISEVFAVDEQLSP